MTMPPEITAFLRENADIIMAALAIAVVLMLLLMLVLFVRLGRLTRLYRRLTRGTSGGNIEELIHSYMDSVTDASRRMTALENYVATFDETQQKCLQKVGLVRYDAFEGVGGELSFSVVILDGRQNGIAITSVYSRSDVRVYAKAIREGQPSHPLTREEEQARALAEGR